MKALFITIPLILGMMGTLMIAIGATLTRGAGYGTFCFACACAILFFGYKITKSVY